MGYTHYWYHDQAKGAISVEAWAKITADAKLIIAAAGARNIRLWHEYDEPGTEPTVSSEQIFLNGAEGEGYETFVLARLGDDFQFCKTARQPYDVVVTAILAVAKEHAPDFLRISSDGDPEEWEDGLALAAQATGRVVPLPLKADKGGEADEAA
jgi:hypothetical protein